MVSRGGKPAKEHIKHLFFHFPELRKSELKLNKEILKDKKRKTRSSEDERKSRYPAGVAEEATEQQ